MSAVRLPLLLALLAAPACRGAADAPAEAAPADAGASAPSPPPLDDAFALARPPRGEITVVALAGETASRKRLAATLQGIVNRREVRIFLVDGDADGKRWWEAEGEEASQRWWLARYADRHGLGVRDEVGLDKALARFSAEAAGYLVAADEEPWTVGAATTLAGLRGALVASAAEAAALDALGLVRLDDLRGRWTDNDACIRATFAEWWAESGGAAVGVLAPEEYRLRDLLVENRVFTVYARPGTEGWDALRAVLADTPAAIPVLGYLSLDAVEEYTAVRAISRGGKVLIPSDTTANLSLHSAVPAALPAPRPVAPADCRRGSALRVAVAISDGDNLAIPLNRYLSDRYWLAPDRGALPIGWSLAPSLAHLAPAAAAAYAEDRGENDELVGMIGLGYAHPTALPDPAWFTDGSLAAMRALGMTAWWHLDLDLYDPQHPYWSRVDAAFAAGAIRGSLLGYVELFPPDPMRTPGGQPILLAAGRYTDTPKQIAARIAEGLAAWRARTGPASLLVSAAVWTNDFAGLRDALAPLAREPDLAFLTPSQLLACLRDE